MLAYRRVMLGKWTAVETECQQVCTHRVSAKVEGLRGLAATQPTSEEREEIMASGYEFYRSRDAGGEWPWWRFKAPNNKIMAGSGEGYSSLTSCDNAIDVIKREAAGAAKT